MIFIAWVLAAILYLLVVGFIFSLLMAWWGRSMDRKSEAKRLREHVLARELARYHHRAQHFCGLIGDTNLVHIDARCVAWTVKVERAAAELRRAKVREALRRLAEKKRAVAGTTAKHVTLN